MEPLRQQQIAMPTVEVYLEIEFQLLMNIAKRLRQHRTLITEDDIISWQTAQLSMLDSLTQENIRVIAKHSGLAIDEVSKALEVAGYEAVDEYEGTLQEAVQEGVLIQPPIVAESAALENILSGYQSQAVNAFNLINTTMLIESQQVYRDIVNNTVGVVMAGSLTPLQGMRDIASKWAEKGIPAFIRKDGVGISTEAYVNMVMRSTVNNVANDMQFTRLDEYECDLIEVSSHMGARPKCSLAQGLIFSRSGTNPKYPAWSSTSFGEPDGILGVNCRHVVYGYVEGISRRTYKPYKEEKNKKAYLESQQQRYLERRIRKAKREVEMLSAMGDKTGAQEAKKKVSERQKAMKEFISETGRRRNSQREQIL